MWETIGLIIAGLFNVLILFVQSYINKKDKRALAQAEAEINKTREMLDFTEFANNWSEIQNEIQKLIETTPVDRFLILKAWNGVNAPRWTSALIQIRSSGQSPVPYLHIELDTDYVEKLRATAEESTSYYVIDKIPESMIKSFYKAEGVKASLWAIIGKIKGKGDTQAVTYCSFATHDDSLLDEDTRTKCRIIVDRLKAMYSEFNEKTVSKVPV